MAETSQTPQEDPEIIRIFPDTSFLVALAIESDIHHQSAESLFGAIVPYKPTFYVTHIVVAETLNKLVKREHIAAKEAIAKIKKLLSRLGDTRSGGQPITIEMVYARYRQFTHKRLIKELDANDFIIVTEAIGVDAKIVTCDKGMYFRSKRAYPKSIFYVSDKASDIKTQAPEVLRLVIAAAKNASKKS